MLLLILFSYMKNNTNINLEATEELKKIAQSIQVARKRRKITLSDLSKRVGVAISTLSRLESGDQTVALGTVLQVLSVLGLVKGISEIIAPENDVAQVLEEVRNLRLGKDSKKPIFSEKELQF
jgi:transcriptional regulator with XRE-family HTH domain